MTHARKRLIYILLTSLSGPVLNIVARQFQMGGDETQEWLNLISALTVSLGFAWGISGSSPRTIVDDARKVEGVQVHVNTAQAESGVIDLAADKDVRNVVPMEGNQRVEK